MLTPHELQEARKQLSNFLKQKRKEKNITSQEMAERINTTPTALSRMENGKHWIGTENLILICHELGIKLFEDGI